MKVLENFIHISTAYAFCWRSIIGEEFYEPPFDSDMIIRMAENLTSENDRNVFAAFAQKIISPWPNTYTFTKAITEDLVRKYGKHFKITIVKPSIGKKKGLYRTHLVAVFYLFHAHKIRPTSYNLGEQKRQIE